MEYDQWIEKKTKYPWPICDDGKVGCNYCKSVGSLKTYKQQGVEISNEWIFIQVNGGKNPNKSARLTNLRHKLIKHLKTNAHLFAVKIEKDKNCNILSNAFETGRSTFLNTTQYIFRTAYYLSKNNRLFSDNLNLVELQHLNGINLGTTLHSRYSSTTIIDHISEQMKIKIVQNIIEIESKISILIDEST